MQKQKLPFFPLTDAEQEKMEASASALKEVIETAFAKFEAEEAK